MKRARTRSRRDYVKLQKLRRLRAFEPCAEILSKAKYLDGRSDPS